MKETREVMTTIRAFAAEDATVIFGTVTDETIGDALRVTVVATGLGRAAARKQSPVSLVRNGTDNLPMGPALAAIGGGAGTFASALLGSGQALAAGGVTTASAGSGGGDYSHLDTPAVWRSREHAAARVAALEEGGADRYDIPAFLRKQAD
jgi:cell division protein FtsZ